MVVATKPHVLGLRLVQLLCRVVEGGIALAFFVCLIKAGKTDILECTAGKIAVRKST